ncbi:MAG: hypothetical protein U9R79_20375 [Armatimonadota bacterium]|nr:hypothetical protein [Armatimonadota bacterium]
MQQPRMKGSDGKPTRVRVLNPHREGDELTEKELEARTMAEEGVEQQRLVYSVRRYEYEAPFNYPNVNCEYGREGTGTGPHPDGVELDVPPFGAVTVEEQEPIIGVTVIGSPCTPPGTVYVFGEPVEWKYGRSGVKFKRTGLWGEHIYGWKPGTPLDEGNRHAGLCSAHFDIPDCRKVTIMGAGQLDVVIGPGAGPNVPLENLDGWWNDPHFNIRVVRIAVRVAE